MEFLIGIFPTWSQLFDGLPKWTGVIVIAVAAATWFFFYRRSRKTARI